MLTRICLKPAPVAPLAPLSILSPVTYHYTFGEAYAMLPLLLIVVFFPPVYDESTIMSPPIEALKIDAV
jgi:hypothetical protein